MKNQKYFLNTALAVIFGLVLLAIVLIRTFAPVIILPKLDIPNLVLISLVALVLDHYLAPEADRCYICIPVLGAVFISLMYGVLYLCRRLSKAKIR